MVGAAMTAAIVRADFKPAQSLELDDTHPNPRRHPQAESRAESENAEQSGLWRNSSGWQELI